MGNPAREHLKKLRRDIQIRDKVESMSQQEIDLLFKHDVNDLSEKEIDKLFGIKRKPWIGWLIGCIGTIIVWSIIVMVILTLI